MSGPPPGAADAPDAAGGVDPLLDLLVDAANVVGSRPDGWWRDRAGAAARLVAQLAPLPGTGVDVPGAGEEEPGRPRGGRATVGRVVVVLEGAARAAVLPSPSPLEVVLAPHDGDSAIVSVAEGWDRPGALVVVTADRGLRARLPSGVSVVGPSWLRRLLDDGEEQVRGQRSRG